MTTIDWLFWISVVVVILLTAWQEKTVHDQKVYILELGNDLYDELAYSEWLEDRLYRYAPTVKTTQEHRLNLWVVYYAEAVGGIMYGEEMENDNVED